MEKSEKVIQFKEKIRSEFFKKKKGWNANWNECCKLTLIPEFILEEFIEELDWNIICTHQILSDNFVRKFKNNINWKIVSKTQHFSEEFLTEMADFVDWFELIFSRDLSKDFLEKHEDKFHLWIDNWYKETDVKGTFNSMKNWFDNSIEGAIQKQTIVRNLSKIGYVCMWDQHYNEIDEEELDYLLKERAGE